MYLADYISNDTRYLFTMVDHFKKIGWAILMKNKNAESTLSAFKQWLSSYLKPKILHIENGEKFINKVIKNYLKENNIYHITGGFYNP